MKYKIGIFGSSSGSMEDVIPKALELGKVLGEYADQFIIVTGAAAGLPYMIAREASPSGIEIWGYSSKHDLESLTASAPDDDQSIYSKLVYIPKDYPFYDNDRACMKYRNVISTANCDAGIIISGRWGSLNEFTNLIDQQKLVGVLTGTGGIADELPVLAQKISKAGQGEIMFDDDPKILIKKILNYLKTVKTA